jgi:putative peptidoglycan lipid II flippase
VTGPTSTARAAVGIGAVTAASRALGFVRVLVVAAVLGATYLGNAFQSANSLSNVLFELLAAGALSAVLVPVFVRLLDEGDDGGAERVAGGVLGLALVVLGAVSVAGILAAPLLARALTAGVPADVADDQRELVEHLLRFFVPQVLLYAVGAVAIAALQARRRFLAAAAAPIGNTVVMVAALLVLRAVAGDDLGLDLSASERWLLVVAGTGGVLAFVGILVVACERSGFRLRPHLPGSDGRVWAALRHSGWGITLHSGAGLLMGAAIVAGAAVAGGVVAYQVGWVFFLAPYAVLAQPLQTAILPELVGEARQPAVLATSVRWSLERTALFTVPATAGMMALAGPAMRGVAFGETGPDDAGLLAAAVAALAVGLLPYSAFLLLARAFYATGDSRWPGLVSVVGALLGVAVMAVGAPLTDGAARVAVLGLGHTAAYLVGAVVLAVGLGRRLGRSVVPGAALVRVVAASAAVGLVGWLVADGIAGGDPNRARDLSVVAGVGALGAVLLLLAYRAVGVRSLLTARRPA